jgi:hypothetical protein
MKFLPTVGLLAALSAGPALAAPVVIDFETVASFAPVGNHYNGGGGPTWGVVFGADALGLRNDALGPYFANAPTPLGVMTPVGPAAILNVGYGFSKELSFFYSSSALIANAVQVWSGLNGTGALLASFNLAANAQNNCTGAPFCRFDQITGTFAGLAQSMTFANATYLAAFDNIRLDIPEPGSILLLALGLSALGTLRRRA